MKRGTDGESDGAKAALAEREAPGASGVDPRPTARRGQSVKGSLQRAIHSMGGNLSATTNHTDTDMDEREL